LEFTSFAFSKRPNLEIPVILNTAYGIASFPLALLMVAIISCVVFSKSSLEVLPSTE
jgi:hypothetical protein